MISPSETRLSDTLAHGLLYAATKYMIFSVTIEIFVYLRRKSLVFAQTV